MASNRLRALATVLGLLVASNVGAFDLTATRVTFPSVTLEFTGPNGLQKGNLSVVETRNGVNTAQTIGTLQWGATGRPLLSGDIGQLALFPIWGVGIESLPIAADINFCARIWQVAPADSDRENATVKSDPAAA